LINAARRYSRGCAWPNGYRPSAPNDRSVPKKRHSSLPHPHAVAVLTSYHYPSAWLTTWSHAPMPINAGIRKLSRNGAGFKISLPSHLVRALAWKVGEQIYVQINPDDSVTLKAITPQPIAHTPIEARP